MWDDELDRLLAPVSPEAPGGENLEYDPAFIALEQAARGRAEQRMGDAVVAGEEPDWRRVEQTAPELLGRTKDLRVAVCLARAWIWTSGLPGLRDGLALLRGLLERYWDTLHPLLDPDDALDPTLRLNTLAALADADATLRAVREAPLAEARGVGRVSLRDVQLAAAGTAEGGPDVAAIEAAFAGCDGEALAATTKAAEEALAHLRAIRQFLAERADAGDTLAELTRVTRAAWQILTDHVAGPAESGTAAPADEARPGEEAMETPRQPSSAGREDRITGRDDAVRLLERLCAYFEEHEPSSPVPLLLRRAKRLVSKNFLDIVRDLAPDGLAQVEALRGVDSEPD